MKNIEEIQTLLGNKSFVIKNEVDFLKFVLKISPYLSFGCKRSINSFLEKDKYEFPIYLRFRSGVSSLVYYDGWSEMKNYNKYNDPNLIEKVDDLTPYLELL